MAELTPTLYIETADVVESFGQCTAAPISFSETMREADAIPSYTRENVRYDRTHGCLTLSPLNAPADEESDYTLSNWDGSTGVKVVLNRITGKRVIRQTAALLDTAWNANWTAGGSADINDRQGLFVWLQRDAPRTDSTPTPANCYVRAAFYGSGGAGYSIHWPYGSPPRLERTDDSGTTWTPVEDIPTGDTGPQAQGAAGTLLVMILRANGYLSFRAAQNNVVPAAGARVPAITLNSAMYVTGENHNASMSFYPVTFPDSGSLTSTGRETPYYNTGSPVVTGDYDGDVTPDYVGSDVWTAQYLLTLASADAGLTTPAVRSVTFNVPPAEIAATTPTWTEVPRYNGFELTQTFNNQELTIDRAGSVTVDNYNGDFMDPEGLFAVRVWAGMQADGVQIWGGYGEVDGLRFAGYLNHTREIGSRNARLALYDRSIVLKKRQMFNPPYLDGDCIYHAIRTLVQTAGITAGGFVQSDPAPADCWTCDGITCDPTTHYRLGVGTGFEPLWRFEQGTTVWEAVQRIRQKYMLAVGFTFDAYFTAYPWQPWGARSAWSPVQTFGSDLDPSAPYPDISQWIDCTAFHSLMDVRNSVTVLGLDQETWQPILAHRLDAESAFGSGFGSAPPVNYLGYIAAMAEASTVYSDPTMADQICQRLFNIYRQPRLSILGTVPAGPYHPLQFVGAGAVRVAADDKYYMTGVSDRWEIRGDGSGMWYAYDSDVAMDLVPYDLASATTDDERRLATNETNTNGYAQAYAIADQTREGVGLAA
jgi:hypothetical protein